MTDHETGLPGARPGAGGITARTRRLAAAVGDTRLRSLGALFGAGLPIISVIVALLPTGITGLTPAGGLLMLAWTLMLAAVAAALAVALAGGPVVVRTLRLSRPLTGHVAAALAVNLAFAVALITGVPQPTLDAVGAYWLPAALLVTLVTAGYGLWLGRRETAGG
ncbi:hypothetical protein HII36_12570 [Nonomuraea sp. NN258]|uniref:hypothetical protein n=1 Tax=Nonomuraea antri TaxID=2730852 RepID=UPI00156823B3|nr:hypothetical protein [Nonomuraea antri]NRQ32666.1 hypothetical protein [Nonomuraea antri]